MSENKRNITILFFVLVVIMLGFGLVIPILPFYIDHFGASGQELGLLMGLYAGLQFLSAPVWGTISDRVGRKPILMVGIFGYVISMLFFALSTQLWMLFVARGLSGLLSSAALPTAMAFISDSTTKEERGGGMGMMGAAMGLGMVLGPGLGGWLSRSYTLATPFFIASALSALTLVFVLVYLPESLPPEKRNKQAHIEVLGQFREMWQALYGPIGFLLLLAFLTSFGLTAFEGVFGLWALYRFDYDSQQVGLVLTVIGLISAIVQGLLTGCLTRRFGEVALIKVSMLATVFGFFIMLAAYNTLTVYLTVSLFILGNTLIRPALSSLTSKRATGGQGVAMGLNNSFMSLGRVVGPSLAGLLLDVNLSYPYIFGAAIMLIGFVLSLFLLRATAVPQPEPI